MRADRLSAVRLDGFSARRNASSAVRRPATRQPVAAPFPYAFVPT
ncbi:hypothetical protein [Streptomyces sp. NPDC056987]